MLARIVGGFGIALAISSQSAAQAFYNWEDATHACVVENANWTRADGAGTGIWSNAPKSFVVSFTDCNQLIDGKASIINSEQMGWYRGQCEQLEGHLRRAAHTVVLVSRELDVWRIRPKPAYGLGLITSEDDKVLHFGIDAAVSMVEYSYLSGDQGDAAWFTLQARCSPLQR